MKTFCRLVTGLAVLLSAASVQAESFNPTNQLLTAQVCVSWPTNTVATNGFGVLTGGKIGIAARETVGFYMSGYASAATTITLKPVLSLRDVPPRVPDGTNLDWMVTSGFSFSLAAAGPFYWCTNFDAYALNGANWIGIYTATNALGTLTNVDYGVNKKIRKFQLE